MSTKEPTDDQLDGLFRKSAEEFNAPFDPAAWQALKNRLDTSDRFTVWEHLLRWGLPVLLLLFLVGGSWNAHQQRAVAGQISDRSVAMQQPTSANRNLVPNRATQRRQQDIDNDQHIPNETTPGLAKPGNLAATAVVQPDDSKQPELIAKAGETIPNADEAAVSSATGKRGRPTMTGTTNGGETRMDKATTLARPAYKVRVARSSSAMTPASTVRRPERPRLGTGQQRRSRRLSGGVMEKRVATTFPAVNYAIEPMGSFTKRQVQPDAIAERLVKESRSGNEPLPTAEAAAPVALLSFIELTNRQGQWLKPLSFTNREVIAPVSSAVAEQVLLTQPTLAQKGLSVRFVVSPDLSAIGLRNFQRPGTNVGLLLDYRLASRWSVQVGVMKSTKVYKALMTEYALPDYTVKWRVLPESVNGRCNMLDIPINLRYDVALRPRLNGQAPSRWFVSGGVTTYIMQQEDYVYNYADVDKPHVYSDMTGWNGSTGRYDFSQLNLSAGYERALSRRLSWQVEPFVKVPLKGVGYYKINLLSTGAFFSLRYKL